MIKILTGAVKHINQNIVGRCGGVVENKINMNLDAKVISTLLIILIS